MKKTKLVRKTPLKRTASLTTKTRLKCNVNLKRKAPLCASNLKTKSNKVNKAKRQLQNSMKGKGRSRTDIQIHKSLVEAGCIACYLLGKKSGYHLQIHHPEGRNKGKAGDISERYAMCLCAGHHDQRIFKGYWSGDVYIPVDPLMPSIHHSKKSFVSTFGTESKLVHESYRLIGETPAWMTSEEWCSYLCIGDSQSKEVFLFDFMKAKKTIRSVL